MVSPVAAHCPYIVRQYNSTPSRIWFAGAVILRQLFWRRSLRNYQIDGAGDRSCWSACWVQPSDTSSLSGRALWVLFSGRWSDGFTPGTYQPQAYIRGVTNPGSGQVTSPLGACLGLDLSLAHPFRKPACQLAAPALASRARFPWQLFIRLLLPARVVGT